MLSLYRALPKVGVNLSYPVYQQRYRTLEESLHRLGILAETQYNRMMEKSEFDLINETVLASFQCTNIDYAELLREVFNSNELHAFISHEILPKMIFLVINTDRFDDKMASALTCIASIIEQTMISRVNLKLIPFLDESMMLGWCPTDLINNMTVEKDRLLSELNTLLEQHDTKGANQVLTQFESLIACVSPDKRPEEKMALFEQWKENQNHSTLTLDVVR